MNTKRMVLILTSSLGAFLLVFLICAVLFSQHTIVQAKSSSPLADATRWRQVNTKGFGDPQNRAIPVMEVYSDVLYAGTFNMDTGDQIWRSLDGMTWTPASQVGFGKADTTAVWSMIVFNGRLYAGDGWSTGRVWRYVSGSNWEQVFEQGGECS